MEPRDPCQEASIALLNYVSEKRTVDSEKNGIRGQGRSFLMPLTPRSRPCSTDASNVSWCKIVDENSRKVVFLSYIYVNQVYP